MSPARRRRAVPKSKGRLEESEQLGIRKLMTGLGGIEYVIGTKRPRGRNCPKCHTFVAEHQGTCQTAGIPDLQFFLPRIQVTSPSTLTRRLVIIEAKREIGGRFTSEQNEYAGLCAAAGIDYIGGNLDDVIAWCIREGYLKSSQVPHYRVPKPRCPFKREGLGVLGVGAMPCELDEGHEGEHRLGFNRR